MSCNIYIYKILLIKTYIYRHDYQYPNNIYLVITNCDALALMRGVKRYFREPWLGSYFFCEPWIVSYFLREPWIDLPLFSLWFVNWVLFSSWTVNWTPLFSLWFVINSFLFPWIVNFAYYLRELSNFPPQIHRCLDLYSFTVMIRNWLLMIDIGLLFSEMWRELWHTTTCTSAFKREYTRFCQHGASLWDHYDTPGAAISPEVTTISPVLWHTLLKDGSREEGVQGIRTPYFFGGRPPPLFFQ